MSAFAGVESERHLCFQLSNNSTSVIKEVFGGVLQSQVKCLTCNGEKIRCEEMMDLILDVENASDMLDSLQQFVQADLLEGDNACFCERCDSKKPAAMTSNICSPPNILTVALRRFYGSTGRKISKDFPFPETFDMRPFMSQPHGPAIKYNLYAVLVHSG
uniref:Ubiquitin carboxyl-terminal hydrolase 36 n=1 Tax=Eptatretus burgeri TaxID=7764 RepID=A0A8C4R7V8_EPTBU